MNGEARGTGGETDGDVTKGREGTKRGERKGQERRERDPQQPDILHLQLCFLDNEEKQVGE